VTTLQRPRPRLVAAAALALGTLHWLSLWLSARVIPLERFDEGILLSTVSLTGHGLLPPFDFYIPYGVGYGALGWAFSPFVGDGALALRLVYALPAAIVTGLSFTIVSRRHGLLFGLPAALLCALAGVPRYDLPIACLLAFVLLSDRPAVSSRGRRRYQLMRVVAAVALGAAAWFRVEYGIFAVLWGVLLLARAGRSAVAWVVVPVVVAVTPYLFGLGHEGAMRHLWWTLSYAAHGFRKYRGIPVSWTFPVKWLTSLLQGSPDRAASLEMLSYGVGAFLIAHLLWRVGAGLCAGSVRTGQGEDAAGENQTAVLRGVLAMFLACTSALVIVAQSVRFGPGNGGAVVGLIWTTLLIAPYRHSWSRAGIAVTGLIIAAPLLVPQLNLPGRLSAAASAPRSGEAIPRLQGMPLRPTEWPALAALASLWGPHGDPRLRRAPLLSVSRRNDTAYGNEAFLYWFLDATPAAWPVTYDPGISDSERVQREVAAKLCSSPAVIVQKEDVYPRNRELAPSVHGSRELDQVLALNYWPVHVAGFYRVLARSSPCLLPHDVPASVVRPLLDQRLRRGELPEAGALATLLMEADARGDARPRTEDVATAIAGGYWVPDAWLPAGPSGVALASLRDRRAEPAAAAALNEPAGPVERLAQLEALVDLRPTLSPVAQRDFVDALVTQALTQPQWPTALTQLLSVVPPDGALLDRLAAAGARGAVLEQARFDLAITADPAAAVPIAVRLLQSLDDPVRKGQVLVGLSNALVPRAPGCAVAVARLADELPGTAVSAPPAPSTSACQLDLRGLR
jgi:hypothetical protein